MYAFNIYTFFQENDPKITDDSSSPRQIRTLQYTLPTLPVPIGNMSSKLLWGTKSVMQCLVLLTGI